ncbi:multi-sensor signal transduction histidine kinase [Halodesulfurarchaeum formicicum]|uniref:histidine kinase n=1 Tax=Halodesulfurarchaeum formicicum TaxID=1873524 RepID=A0A1D8S2U4_9EURY|nr:HAMP domain-containing sensor histidine kinase [Halodesulfurarchaeum formicicum]AOW79682.1 multi-sensor signal transduction histidine kinase [Halodesulfurarchaeum formicicum]
MSSQTDLLGSSLSSIRTAVGHLVDTASPMGGWLLVGSGIGLTALSELVFFVYGNANPGIRVLELLLPMAVGIGLIWVGFQSRQHGFSSWQIAVLGLSVLLGMGVFVVIATYMRLLLSLEQPLPAKPLYLLLNAMAIGAVLNFVYAYQYLKIRDRADRLAVRRDRLVGVISLVSHDIRNPLTVAKGYADMAGEHAAPLVEALERIETMVQELLALAHSTQSTAALEPVAVAAIARESWGVVETEAADLEIATETEVLAEPDQLRHLFENLFRNAIEHGGTAVTVTVGDFAGGFYVADDGPGIPESDRETAFEPGYTTAESGTGLGLNIVQEICVAHDWDVAVTESRAGGARFEFDGVEFPD